MIKIYHVKRDGNKIDISNLRIKMSLSSSLGEVARTLDLSLYCKDYRDVFLGEIIEFNGIEYHIFKKDMDSEGGQMNLTCFDKLIYLKKNQASYNFKNQTPEDITKKICSEFNIKVNYIQSTGIKINRKFRNVDLYGIIQTAYTMASEKTGKKYYMTYNNGLTIKEAFVENGVELKEGLNIIKVSHSEDLQNMINAVIVYNENQEKVQEIKNDSWISLYGKLSLSFEKTKDGEQEDYKSNLKDIEKTLNAECVGDLSLTTGKCVHITEKDTNIKGLFYIKSDTHNFENSTHTTSLELSFEKIMDEQSLGEEEKENKKTQSKK